MHTITFKNKRSKAVLTLQWEQPEDLLAWAESVKDSKGMEFNMVDPAIPITLKSDAPPAPKLKKVVPKASKGGAKSFSEIEILLLSILQNLQEEFELLMCKSFVNENTLNDKKLQMDSLKIILESLAELSEQQEKTEYCLINYGVSAMEYRQFLNKSLDEIINKATENKTENSVQIPRIFMQIKERIKYGDVALKISETPTLGIKRLIELAKNKRCNGI